MHHGLLKIKPYLPETEFEELQRELEPWLDKAEKEIEEMTRLRRLISEGASHEEIADEIGCSETSVRRTERTALRKCFHHLNGTRTVHHLNSSTTNHHA